MVFRRRDVFVGHASADDDIADAVIERLRQGGLRPFVDHEPEGGIPIGCDWERELRDSIRRAGLFVPLVSDDWLDSSWCQAEHQVAKLLGKPVVPFILDGRLTREVAFVQQALRIDGRLTSLDEAGLRQLRRLCAVDRRRAAATALLVAGCAGLGLWLADCLIDGAPELVPPEMALIPGGTVTRGAWDASEDAQPPRDIRLDSFLLDRHEADWGTFKQYLETGAERHRPPNWVMRYIPSERHPVVGVTWEAVAGFCAWRGKRLPSEAEWEHAARGAAGQRFPWGDEPVAVAPERPPHPSPTDAVSFDRSPQGVLNLAGNVREWVEDWYDPDYYATSPDESPVNLSPSSYRGVRGGSWLDSELPAAARRGANMPDRPDREIGVRCARDWRGEQGEQG